MSDLIYHLRYAWRLYRKTDLSISEAWAWGLPARECRGDPVEDADDEIFYASES